MRRPDRIWSIEVKRIFRQKRYKKVFGKKASERERHLNGNYALCILYALIMHIMHNWRWVLVLVLIQRGDESRVFSKVVLEELVVIGVGELCWHTVGRHRERASSIVSIALDTRCFVVVAVVLLLLLPQEDINGNSDDHMLVSQVYHSHRLLGWDGIVVFGKEETRFVRHNYRQFSRSINWKRQERI